MKPIHFPQKLSALLTTIAVATSLYAGDLQTTDYDWRCRHDFVVDNFAYRINFDSITVELVESAGLVGHVDIPTHVTYNDTGIFLIPHYFKFYFFPTCNTLLV